MRDLYGVLGLEAGATAAEVRVAFRRWAATHHPDRGGDTRRFAAVAAAVDRLTEAPASDVESFRRTSTYAMRRWARRRWQRRRHPRVR